MARLSHSDSNRMYSWWWDSHISPKNSRWLQENLTDMDVKVKSMIKLIEEDADSFARRAEMYYKKRPELMKLVEEFYRAYRALAERYDHATGVIRHAHKTMTEAFPNQVPSLFGDDSPPEMLTPLRAIRDLDGFQKDTHEKGRVRKGLDFDKAEDKEQSVSTKDEISKLKEALAKLEAEKEAGLAQYQQSLDKLSKLESDIAHAQEISQVFNDRANNAENEVVVLKEVLSKLEAEKEASLQEYQHSVERISNLESAISSAQEDAKKLNERATKAESESQSLKDELAKVAVEKDEALDQYMQSLEVIANLENKLRLTEEDAGRLKERAEKAEGGVKSLKQLVSKLTEEKEAAAVQYQRCLETISSLEEKLKCAEEEAKRLNVELDNGLSKLKGAEEQCLLLEKSNQSLHSELETLVVKMGTQTQELTEKQKELGKLRACLQEERLRFVEAETAFQTLQHLHSQTQEELRSMASELQKRAQVLMGLEAHNQSMQDEVVKVKEENKHLDELNASSALSIKNMQNEMSNLKEINGKLEEEVELRLDQRNALQQEIYCLKEELNDLNKKHNSILDQVRAVDLNPETLESSVRELKDEKLSLNEAFRKESTEKVALLEKLELLDQLLEKNAMLENSLSDLDAELEAVRGNIKVLEQSCRALLEEKSSLLDQKANLMTQIQVTNEKLDKLSESNTVLENSLSDTQSELQALREKSKILEDSCQLLIDEKAALTSERDSLTSELETTRTRVEVLQKIHQELEQRCTALEKEKESSLSKVEDLKMALDVEQKENHRSTEMSKMQVSGILAEMHLLQEESQQMKTELDKALDAAFNCDIEIFILQNVARELEGCNCSLLNQNQKLLDKSCLLEKLISELERNSLQKEVEIKSLFDQTSILREGTYHILQALSIVADPACENKIEQDQIHLNLLINKLEDMKASLCRAEEENQQITVEQSLLIMMLRQLSIEAQNLELEKSTVQHEVKVKTEQLLVLQNDVLKLGEMNEELLSKLKEGDCKSEALVAEIGTLQNKLLDVQNSFQKLQMDNSEICEEKRSLEDKIMHSEEKNQILEEENRLLCGQVISLDSLSLVLASCIDEKIMALRQLYSDLNKVHHENSALTEKLCSTENRLKESQRSLADKMLHMEEKNQLLEEENHLLCGQVLSLDSLSLMFSTCVDEKIMALRQLGDDLNKVHDVNSALTENLHSTEDRLKESKMGNLLLVERVQKSEDELSVIKEQLRKEIEKGKAFLHQKEVAIQEAESKINMLEKEKSGLDSDLQEKSKRMDMWETAAAACFGELQSSIVSQLLYKHKIYELHEACVGFMDESDGLKTQLSAFDQAVVSLRECISSLENHTGVHEKLPHSNTEKMEGAPVANHLSEELVSTDEKTPTLNTLTDLVDLKARVQAIEKAAVGIKQKLVNENLDMHHKLEAATRQVEELKSENAHYQRYLKPKSEISEAENLLLTKDIMLDQASESLSYRRERVENDNQIIEVWRSGDLDKGIDLKKSVKPISPSREKNKDFHRVNSIKKQKSDNPISDEKEMSLGKLEISKRYSKRVQEGNKKKVLERLNSDVQKLATLQMTVEDLKSKLEGIEKRRRGKALIECETLKGQLEEADMAIMKLFDLNGKLTNNIGDSSFSDIQSSFGSEKEVTAGRRIPEQARRMSEKIGRLQLEIQKIQFVLLKLDDNKEGGQKTRMSEMKRRVLLRDYLYGRGKASPRRKKASFCACIQPSTVED